MIHVCVSVCGTSVFCIQYEVKHCVYRWTLSCLNWTIWISSCVPQNLYTESQSSVKTVIFIGDHESTGWIWLCFWFFFPKFYDILNTCTHEYQFVKCTGIWCFMFLWVFILLCIFSILSESHKISLVKLCIYLYRRTFSKTDNLLPTNTHEYTNIWFLQNQP